MKLATVNPMLYDFGVDMDTFMLKPDEVIINKLIRKLRLLPAYLPFIVIRFHFLKQISSFILKNY